MAKGMAWREQRARGLDPIWGDGKNEGVLKKKERKGKGSCGGPAPTEGMLPLGAVGMMGSGTSS